MKHRFAFAGFRHGHIYGLYDRVKNDADCEIVGACEEDAASRPAVRSDIELNYPSIAEMLDKSGCDCVAIGDYYGKRGKIAVEALKRGKHVIADKPLCTSLAELDEITRLAKEKGLKIGCMLDLRTAPDIATARRALLDGVIGEIVQIQFSGQHPLLPASRPGWYFEPGKHGGTINDIAIHGIDAIPWMTGRKFKSIVAARTWKAYPVTAECFKDAGQFMLELDNSGGVLADVSYDMVNTQGYTLPTYWRFNFWGTRGMLEIIHTANTVRVYSDGAKSPTVLGEIADVGPDYLASFLADVDGKPGELDTAQVLASTRLALEIQQAADARG